MNKKHLGLYAGSFNPFHIGHLNIVNQARNVFDKVLVAQGINTEKDNKRKYQVPNSLNAVGIFTTTFDGLLTDLVKYWEKTYDVTLVRGLRNGNDLEYEQNLTAFLKDMYPSIKIVAFYCEPQYRHISSSSIRALEAIAPEEYKKYIVL